MPFRRLVVQATALAAAACWGCAHEPTITELDWTEGTGFRWATVEINESRRDGFTELSAARSNIRFANIVEPDDFLSNRHLANGSGVATGDINGDGLPDIYLAALNGPNALYLNRGGLRFEEVTETSNAECTDRYSTGVTMADIDGDRDLDLLVTSLGGAPCVLLNDGTGVFVDASQTSGLAEGGGAMSMALADVDADGDLDLYVGNYKVRTVRDFMPPEQRAFEHVVETVAGTPRLTPEFRSHFALERTANKTVVFEIGESDRFYLNNGNGRFTHVPFTSGRFLDEDGKPLTDPPHGWALAVRFQDLNGDGAPDLYVCNDFESPDDIWLNDGDATFRRISRLAVRKTSYSSMSVDAADVNRDGHVDLFVADMLNPDPRGRLRQVAVLNRAQTSVGEIENRSQEMQNVLLVARGDGTFVEMGHYSGVAATGWTWSSIFLDVDLDGYEDLLVANGNAFDLMDADTQERMAFASLKDEEPLELTAFPPLLSRNMAFRNAGSPTPRFEPMPEGWGIGTEPDIAHGMASADFDLDGDLDLVVNRLNAEAAVFRNDASGSRIAVRLVGVGANTKGVGAHIRVEAADLPVQTKEIVAGGQYLSGSEALSVFAAGSEKDSVRITVRWPGGGRSTVVNAHPNRIYEIHESGAVPETASRKPSAKPPSYFVEVDLHHTQSDGAYEDFIRQPLLPRRMSRLGPAAAWIDLDDDGDDDLLVGAGRGGRLGVFRNDHGELIEWADAAPAQHETFDLTGIVATPRGSAGPLIFVGVSNYERAPKDEPRESEIRVYEFSGGRMNLIDTLPFGYWSIGPLALGDLDGDGDLDLFAGGRHVPGRYPEPARSAVFSNDGGRFVLDVKRTTYFSSTGMVSGAVIGDVDGDGDQDVVLAEEWGPVRLFRNEGHGRFRDDTAAAGLQAHLGWWNGVTLSDFNGDGLLDIVATNWGWNSMYGRPDVSPGSASQGLLRAYYGDFDANGVLDVFETSLRDGVFLPVRGLHRVSEGFPGIRRRAATHARFSDTPADELLGSALSAARTVETRTLGSYVFLQGRRGFEPILLPAEAQLVPGFAPAVADVNADGREDLFLSQNFFGVAPDDARLDGGRGLWMLGDGTGRFDVLSGPTSGVAIYGEQRAAATADFNADGRIDLLVTQHGAATRLFRNEFARSGYPVRLFGPPLNPSGVGAVLRILYEDGTLGPARLVTAGSGYLSQHGSIHVLGSSDSDVVGIRVEWPDGSTSEFPVTTKDAAAIVAHESSKR